jgi:lysophospholipase L1-like esterase
MCETLTITESELRRRLGEESSAAQALAQFFEPDLLSARLVIRENVEIVPDEPTTDKGLRDKVSGAALSLANSVCASFRQRRYRKVISENPNLVRAVAEGDSWFLHPQIPDIIDQLFGKTNPRMAVLSLAAAGDDLAYMWRHNQYMAAVETEKPKWLLLSGGGNDILGREFPGYLNDYSPGAPGQDVQRFLNSNFDRKLRHLREVYNGIIRDVRGVSAETKIAVHGYDYVQPGVDKPDKSKQQHKGKWLGKHLSNAQISETADRHGVVRVMVDEFNNQVLRPLSDANDNFVYVDVRGCVGTHEWFDEIHPNERGFNAVTIRIDSVLAEH